jgi:carbamoyl-phosphate synthase large subunit
MNILITGAGGPAAVGVIKSLKGLNTSRHHLVAVDSDPLAVGLYLCSAHYVIPKIDEENYYDELKKVIEKENIDLILPTSDDVIPISMMKKIYFKDINLFMSDYHSIATCHNKMLFYKKCSEDFRLPYTTDKFIPVFTKPITGKGSVGIELIDRKEEGYIYQDYLPGKEYTIDVLCDMNSNVLSVIPRVRLQTKAGISTKGRIVRDDFIESECKKICEFLELKGAVCIQMKENEDGDPLFIEINPRFGGGTYFTTLAGVNFVKIILELVEGREVKVPEPKEITVLRYFEEVII